MRKQVMAIAARVSAAKRLLDSAEVHIRDAAVEEDPQHSTALLTLGGELADYAELILRNVNDGPEPRQEPEVAPQQPTTCPGGRWFHWQEQGNNRWTAKSGDYYAVVKPLLGGQWLLDVVRTPRPGLGFTNYSAHDTFNEACEFAEQYMESAKKRENSTAISEPAEAVTQQPKQPRIELQWREGFADTIRDAWHDKYKAVATLEHTGKWHLQIFVGDFMASFSQHDNFDSLSRLADDWVNHHIEYYSKSEVNE